MAPPKVKTKPPSGFPRELRVRHRVYSVDYVPPDHPAVNEDGTELLGCCESRKTTIAINLNQSPASMRDTTIHEACHAHYHGSGMPADEDTEERAVEWATDLILALEEAGWLAVKF